MAYVITCHCQVQARCSSVYKGLLDTSPSLILSLSLFLSHSLSFSLLLLSLSPCVPDQLLFYSVFLLCSYFSVLIALSVCLSFPSLPPNKLPLNQVYHMVLFLRGTPFMDPPGAFPLPPACHCLIFHNNEHLSSGNILQITLHTCHVKTAERHPFRLSVSSAKCLEHYPLERLLT